MTSPISVCDSLYGQLPTDVKGFEALAAHATETSIP
jgi:hypothetical protein